MSGNIKVVVRCRPLNARELARGAHSLVRMDGDSTYLSRPDGKESKSFAFDKSYWSACARDEPGYASQQSLFDYLGLDLLQHALDGFNTCLFAYGQTSSGKSYSMMGYDGDRGMIPLICESLFERITQLESADLSFTVEASYMEIYQEKVRDLLNPGNTAALRVREHPSTGAYVEGLSRLAVGGFIDIERLIEEGTKARTVASTNMNETSSRSHSIFTLILCQTRRHQATKLEKVSRISLVDLAGSERANATGATGVRLKEGSLINKSLTTLGRVIAALAASSGGKRNAEKVPYRDSVLTFLLKDSLGGNSKTAMIAAISPADYEETLSTLRYADQAKKIINKAVVNEDANTRVIRELTEELATLRNRISSSSSESVYDAAIPPEQQIVQYRSADGELRSISKSELQQQLEQGERLMAEVTQTWDEKLRKTREVAKKREVFLESCGIVLGALDQSVVGISTPKKMPHLVNLNEDPLMNECLFYGLKAGRTSVGNSAATRPADILLSGSSILLEHCHFEHSLEGRVTIHSRVNSITLVNGQRVLPSQPKELQSGCRIILGDYHVFRFNHPEAVRKLRDAGSRQHLRSPFLDNSIDADPLAATLENADWSFAQREALACRFNFNGTDVEMESMTDEELDQLVRQVRTSRESSSMADRSESRLSHFGSESRLSRFDSMTEAGDDDASSAVTGSPHPRPFSAATWSTADTSTSPDVTAEVEERLAIVKAEYEERIREMAVAAAESERVLAIELQGQVEKVKKLSAQAVSSSTTVEELGPLTEEEIGIARMVVENWQRKGRIKMAETALAMAMELKEANITSRELDDRDGRVSFQFVVLEDDIPVSASRLSLLDNDDITLDSSPIRAGRLGIKVIDRRRRAVELETMTKFKTRVERMKNILHLRDRPAYSRHFAANIDSLECSPFSFVASALFSLLPLSKGISSSSTVQLYSPYTADPLGSVRVQLIPTSSGQLNLVIDRISGLSKSEFSSFHLQLRHSALFGNASFPEDHDDHITSDVYDLERVSSPDISFRQSIPLDLASPALLDHFRNNYASLHIFAVVKLSHLDKIERWDEAREGVTDSRAVGSIPLRDDVFDGDVTRRSENELVSEQRHDVSCAVEILELGSDGSYSPVPVLSQSASPQNGTFFLRQGIQRRVVIKLVHSSGRSFAWKRITRVTLGNVLDERGRFDSSAPANQSDIELIPAAKERARFESDGTSSLQFIAAWDSSNSPLLNHASHTKLSMRLKLEIDGNCSAPVKLEMDLSLTVHHRDSRGPVTMLGSLFGAKETVSHKITNLFAVRLTPLLTRSPTDIWRLNTTEIFVRGEEVLQQWKPRGLSLIRDYDKTTRDKRRAADVEATKSILASIGPIRTIASDSLSKDERLQQFIRLWKSYPTTQISIHRATNVLLLSSSTTASGTPSPVKSAAKSRRLVPAVTLVEKSLIVGKRGHLYILSDPSTDEWRKVFAVFRRPYLHLYPDSNETDEISVINLTNVRIERGEEIEKLLRRVSVFAMFTQNNSFFAQAPPKEMLNWVHAIDPSLRYV